jgi:hypothetical protein
MGEMEACEETEVFSPARSYCWCFAVVGLVMAPLSFWNAFAITEFDIMSSEVRGAGLLRWAQSLGGIWLIKGIFLLFGIKAMGWGIKGFWLLIGRS